MEKKKSGSSSSASRGQSFVVDSQVTEHGYTYKIEIVDNKWLVFIDTERGGKKVARVALPPDAAKNQVARVNFQKKIHRWIKDNYEQQHKKAAWKIEAYPDIELTTRELDTGAGLTKSKASLLGDAPKGGAFVRRGEWRDIE